MSQFATTNLLQLLQELQEAFLIHVLAYNLVSKLLNKSLEQEAIGTSNGSRILTFWLVRKDRLENVVLQRANKLEHRSNLKTNLELSNHERRQFLTEHTHQTDCQNTDHRSVVGQEDDSMIEESTDKGSIHVFQVLLSENVHGNESGTRILQRKIRRLSSETTQLENTCLDSIKDLQTLFVSGKAR